MDSYHNTTDVCGRQLHRYQDKALAQDERLLAYFEATRTVNGHHILLTASGALERVFNNSVPITSVRRALSNLTRDGKLYKSEHPVMSGPCGRPVHYWRLVEKNPQQDMF